MGVPELKKELHDYIDHADERFLKMVFAMSREYNPASIVGYNVDGSPITKEAHVKRVVSASKRENTKIIDFIEGLAKKIGKQKETPHPLGQACKK